MFEEIDLQIGDEVTESSSYIIHFTQYVGCTRTGSGGYGTSCKYCC
jgi:hypothetical protein